jgi:hypothetical protein
MPRIIKITIYKNTNCVISCFIGTKMLLGQEKPVFLRLPLSIICVCVEKWP